MILDADPDQQARDRVVIAARRQAFVTQLARVRSHVVIGAAQAVGGLALFAGCVYIALRAGMIALWPGAVGFLLIVAGGYRIVRALAGGVSARRQLRRVDARGLPAARIVRS